MEFYQLKNYSSLSFFQNVERGILPNTVRVQHYPDAKAGKKCCKKKL
jgi:hypothetical protein